jgi:hydroxyacylglutathione hydrolase
MNNTQVYPVRAFQDNYIWTIHNKTHAVIVDPGESEPVIDFLRFNKLTLAAILVTHHHPDHVGGIKDIVRHYDVPVYGPKTESIPAVSQRLIEGDLVRLDALGLTFKVLDIPGHTAGHIAYYDDQRLFCGDTLFSCGCGRIFEGTPSQMFHSIEKLTNLPDSTEVYCTHEYTLSNIKFALSVEPDNQNLKNYEKIVKAKLSNKQVSLPSSISLEKSINPFLRYNEPSVIDAAQTRSKTPVSNEVDVFATIRAWKDNF